jgi:hypothetical protein
VILDTRGKPSSHQYYNLRVYTFRIWLLEPQLAGIHPGELGSLTRPLSLAHAFERVLVAVMPIRCNSWALPPPMAQSIPRMDAWLDLIMRVRHFHFRYYSVY